MNKPDPTAIRIHEDPNRFREAVNSTTAETGFSPRLIEKCRDIVASRELPYGLTGVVRQIRIGRITCVQVIEMPVPCRCFKLFQDAGYIVIGTGDEKRFAIPAEFNGRDRSDAVSFIQDVLRQIEMRL